MTTTEPDVCGRCRVYRHLHPTTRCEQSRREWPWDRWRQHSPLHHAAVTVWVHAIPTRARWRICHLYAKAGRDWCQLVDIAYRADNWPDWANDYRGDNGCLCAFLMPWNAGPPRPGWCYCPPKADVSLTIHYQDEHVTIHHGDALNLPIPDHTIDLIVTSPPYFGLRSYTDSGEHYAGQIGAEATPGEFVDALIAATREMVRVLKPSGSIFVNLGDRYAGSAPRTNNNFNERWGNASGKRAQESGRPDCVSVGAPTKSLIGIPWRYALRCIDDLGLTLRAEIIWSKPNGLPESVTDRVRRSHEQWFHFTVQPRYYSASDSIREPHNDVSWIGRAQQERRNNDRNDGGGVCNSANPLGKMPGSVWDIPTQPLTVPKHLGIDHFAAFPLEWPRRIIRGWSPPGVCTACGEGRQPVVDNQRTLDGQPILLGAWKRGGVQQETAGVGNWRFGTERRITGEACACPEPTAPTTPALVLDPFGGTGTTALVAKALGRRAVHVDLSHDYCRLAQWRVTDPGELARALQVEKPPPAPDGMGSLLDLIDQEDVL